METKRPGRARRSGYIALGVAALALLGWVFRPSAGTQRETAERASPVIRDGTLSADLPALTIAPPPPSDATLSGTVYGLNTQPLAGATVCASCAGCNLVVSDFVPICTRSDAGGKYALHELRSGDYLLSAAAEGYVPKAANGGRAINIPVRGERAVSNLDIQLEEGGAAVTGVVIDATGGPVAGATIQATSGTDVVSPTRIVQATTSDEQGRFALSCPAGHVALRAIADGYAPGFASRPAPASDVEVIVTPASRIRGVVVTEQGQPVANISVLAKTRTGTTRQASSDGAGRFDISGLTADVYQLEARGTGWLGVHPATIALSVADSADEVVITVKRAASIRGILLAEDRSPCPHGQVHLGPGPGSYSVPFLHTVSTAQGAVSFEAVPPGSYRVSIGCRIGDLQPAQTLEVGSSDQSGMVWKIEPQLAVEGDVVDERGQPVAGFNISLRSTSQAAQMMYVEQTRADGTFSFRGIPAGQYTLASPDIVESINVELRERSVTGQRLRAKALGHIAVHVVTPEGKPLDDLSIQALGADGRPFDSPEALGNGRYQLGPLPAGSYALQIGDGVNPPAQAGGPSGVTIVRGGETTRVELRYGGYRGQIAGRVRDEGGAPIENVWVQALQFGYEEDPLAPVRQTKVVAEARRSLTDAEGRFELTGLSENNTFVVRAEWPLGGEARVTGVKAGATIDIVLQALGSLSGTVVGTGGQPIEHLIVQLVNGQTGQQRTDVVFAPGGKWRIDDVTPGPLQVTVNDPSGNVAVASWTLAPKQALGDLRLVLAPQPPEVAQGDGHEHAEQ